MSQLIVIQRPVASSRGAILQSQPGLVATFHCSLDLCDQYDKIAYLDVDISYKGL